MHRDVKPQNVVVSEPGQCCKLIDLGAAADLRIGINYIPDEFLLDPRYAPPQQYIMSPQTARRVLMAQPEWDIVLLTITRKRPAGPEN